MARDVGGCLRTGADGELCQTMTDTTNPTTTSVSSVFRARRCPLPRPRNRCCSMRLFSPIPPTTYDDCTDPPSVRQRVNLTRGPLRRIGEAAVRLPDYADTYGALVPDSIVCGVTSVSRHRTRNPHVTLSDWRAETARSRGLRTALAQREGPFVASRNRRMRKPPSLYSSVFAPIHARMSGQLDVLARIVRSLNGEN